MSRSTPSPDATLDDLTLDDPTDDPTDGLGAPAGLAAEVDALAKAYDDEMVAVRRDVHAHPELSRAEVRTTRVLRDRLVDAGLSPRTLPTGTGLVADVGADAPALALRADIDALPIRDTKDVPYRSTVEGVCHACGHDVHTAALLGAALVLADLDRAGRLPSPVRLLFQPAEEATPGGAVDVVAAGGLDGVRRILALHCDPRLEVGRLGVRTGAITAAADQVAVRLAGPGGHTARPYLTADLVHALATLAAELPAALSRRVDPRAGLSVVWGRIAAGTAPNAIPARGELEGTLRCLDAAAWERAPDLVRELVAAVVAPYGVSADVDYVRGVPPVVNTAGASELLARAGRSALGADAVTTTEQSLGGEDFAWYLQHVDGALGRLGVARPVTGHGPAPMHDLHQGGFDVDERAIGAGIRLFATAALLAVG